MTGIDFARTRDELNVPERDRIEAAATIGRIADKSILPDALQIREVPSDRKPVAEFAYAGSFPD